MGQVINFALDIDFGLKIKDGVWNSNSHHVHMDSEERPSVVLHLHLSPQEAVPVPNRNLPGGNPEPTLAVLDTAGGHAALG
jgi:hypothetical protein